MSAGDDVRPIGDDVAAGQEVLPAGTRPRVAEIEVVTVGAARAVTAHPAPRVGGPLPSGDELVEVDATPGPGQIHDSNRPTLAAAVAAAGGQVIDLGIAGDTPAALEAAMVRGLAEADVLLTSGGVSMGNLDLIKPLLDRLGSVHFGRLRMKPGKPCTFATVESGALVARLCAAGQPGEQPGDLLSAGCAGAAQPGGRPDPHLPRGGKCTSASRCPSTRTGPNITGQLYGGRRRSTRGAAGCWPTAPATRPAAVCSVCARPTPCSNCRKAQAFWRQARLSPPCRSAVFSTTERKRCGSPNRFISNSTSRTTGSKYPPLIVTAGERRRKTPTTCQPVGCKRKSATCFTGRTQR